MEWNGYKGLRTDFNVVGGSNRNTIESLFEAVQNLQTANVRMEERIFDLETQVARLSKNRNTDTGSEKANSDVQEITTTAIAASQGQNTIEPASNHAIDDRKELSVTRLTNVVPDTWLYNELNLCMEVDGPVSVSGFLLYGSYSSTAAHRVAMQICHHETGQVLVNHNAILNSDGSKSLFPVRFASPVDLEPEVTYSACVTVNNGLMSFRGKGGMQEVAGECGTIFTFSDADNYYNRDGSVGTQGQIPGILYMV